MRFRETHRVPLLLFACLATALVFPHACAETRAGLGALFPATAELSAAPVRDELREENAKLREDVARARAENARLEDAIEARPIASEGPLAGVRTRRQASGPAPTALVARVLQRDASATRRSFLVDAGRSSGVTVGLPVLFGGSVVGVVATASGHAARVLGVDDPACVLPAAVLASRADGRDRRGLGVARGTGRGDLVVSMLRAGDAAKGDLVVTGPGRADLPEGLVLGEVVEFRDLDHDGSYEALVRPLRDLDTLLSVAVLLPAGRDGPEVGAGAPR